VLYTVDAYLTDYLIFLSFRAKEWARAAGRFDLLNRNSFRNFYVCSRHFSDTMYNCPRQRHTSSSLVHDAVPNLLSLDVTEPSHMRQDVPSHSVTADAPSQRQLEPTRPMCTDSFAQTSLKMSSLVSLEKQVKRLQNQIRSLKAFQRRRRKHPTPHVKLEGLPPDLADFIANQLNNFNRAPRGRRYTATYYKNCFLLYHHSRRCYAALRTIVCMPSPRCLRKKLESFFDKVRFSRLDSHFLLYFHTYI